MGECSMLRPDVFCEGCLLMARIRTTRFTMYRRIPSEITGIGDRWGVPVPNSENFQALSREIGKVQKPQGLTFSAENEYTEERVLPAAAIGVYLLAVDGGQSDQNRDRNSQRYTDLWRVTVQRNWKRHGPPLLESVPGTSNSGTPLSVRKSNSNGKQDL